MRKDAAVRPPLPPQPESNDTRLRELMLYIATRSQDDPRCGAIKLNKLLFYSDFSAYMRFGRAITGAEYQKLKNGPAPRRLPVVRSAMIAEGLAELREVDYHGRPQHRLIPIRDGLAGLFDRKDLLIVDSVIKACFPLNADEISERSHGFIGWQVVGFRETIPYGLALIGNRTPTRAEREYGMSLEAEGLAELPRL